MALRAAHSVLYNKISFASQDEIKSAGCSDGRDTYLGACGLNRLLSLTVTNVRDTFGAIQQYFVRITE